MSNIHMVGCMDCNSNGVLFEGKPSLAAAAGVLVVWKLLQTDLTALLLSV